jgi:hypothetical protein
MVLVLVFSLTSALSPSPSPSPSHRSTEEGASVVALAVEEGAHPEDKVVVHEVLNDLWL